MLFPLFLCAQNESSLDEMSNQIAHNLLNEEVVVGVFKKLDLDIDPVDSLFVVMQSGFKISRFGYLKSLFDKVNLVTLNTSKRIKGNIDNAVIIKQDYSFSLVNKYHFLPAEGTRWLLFLNKVIFEDKAPYEAWGKGAVSIDSTGKILNTASLFTLEMEGKYNAYCLDKGTKEYGRMEYINLYNDDFVSDILSLSQLIEGEPLKENRIIKLSTLAMKSVYGESIKTSLIKILQSHEND